MLPPFLLPGDLEEECLELPPFFFTIFEDDGGRLESEFSSSEDVSDPDGVFPLCPVGRRSTLTGEEAWTSTSAAGGLGSKIIDGGSLLTEPSSEVVSASSACWPEARRRSRRLANRATTASNWSQDSISQSEQIGQCGPFLWQSRWSEHLRWCVHGSDCTNLVANLEQ